MFGVHQLLLPMEFMEFISRIRDILVSPTISGIFFLGVLGNFVFRSTNFLGDSLFSGSIIYMLESSTPAHSEIFLNLSAELGFCTNFPPRHIWKFLKIYLELGNFCTNAPVHLEILKNLSAELGNFCTNFLPRRIWKFLKIYLELGNFCTNTPVHLEILKKLSAELGNFCTYFPSWHIWKFLKIYLQNWGIFAPIFHPGTFWNFWKFICKTGEFLHRWFSFDSAPPAPHY